MTMIQCPFCNKDISDKAEKCVHCGKDICKNIEKILVYCPECKQEIDEDEIICPHCGYPINNFSDKQKNKKKKIHILRTVIIILILVSMGFWGYGKFQSNNTDKYLECFLELAANQADGLDSLNECRNLLMDVWHNSIYHEFDERTDKYTCPDGFFVEDFNIALDNLYADPEFSNTCDFIRESQLELRKIKKELPNPPEGWEEFNELVIQLIDNQIEFSMIILNLYGSYNDVSEKFDILVTEYDELMNEILVYSQIYFEE